MNSKILVLLVIIPLSSGYVDCRIACRTCRELMVDQKLLEVYCAMCDECKQRRRERMQLKNELVEKNTRVGREAQLNQEQANQPQPKMTPNYQYHVPQMENPGPPIHNLQPHYPPNCPTPPPCSETEEEVRPEQMNLETPNESAPTCPPVEECVPKTQPYDVITDSPAPPRPTTTFQHISHQTHIPMHLKLEQQLPQLLKQLQQLQQQLPKSMSQGQQLPQMMPQAQPIPQPLPPSHLLPLSLSLAMPLPPPLPYPMPPPMPYRPPTMVATTQRRTTLSPLPPTTTSPDSPPPLPPPPPPPPPPPMPPPPPLIQPMHAPYPPYYPSCYCPPFTGPPMGPCPCPLPHPEPATSFTPATPMPPLAYEPEPTMSTKDYFNVYVGVPKDILKD